MLGVREQINSVLEKVKGRYIRKSLNISLDSSVLIVFLFDQHNRSTD